MATVPALLVTEVVVFLLRKVVPALLGRAGSVAITRVTRPLSLVEQELLSIARIT
jgi:hypothetical protein